jgi:hypothetical protein
MNYERLSNVLETNFIMTKEHNFSITELENMLPWERQIYLGLVVNYVKEQKEKMDQDQASMKTNFHR